MTVPSEQSRIQYTTDGTSVSFPVPFRFLNAAHLQVARQHNDESSILELGVDYSVSGVGNQAGGTITTTTTLPAGDSISIERVVPITQETAYQRNDPFPERAHEQALDKLTMISQMLGGILGLTPGSKNRALLLGTADFDGSGSYRANKNRIQDVAKPIRTTDAARLQDIIERLADLSTDGSGQYVIERLADTVDPSNGTGMIGVGPLGNPEPDTLAWINNSLSVPSVADINTIKVSDNISGRRIVVGGFYKNEVTGGGIFTFDQTVEKSLHDGRNFISPTVFWDGSSATVSDFLSGAGESDPSGFGVWKRQIVESGDVCQSEFGLDLQEACKSLVTEHPIFTGGVVNIPTGLQQQTAPTRLEGAGDEKILNIRLSGKGKQASTLSYLGVADASGITAVRPIFLGFEGISIRDCAHDAIELLSSKPSDVDQHTWNHIVVRDVRLSFNGRYGLRAERGFMGRFEGAYATHNQAAGFRFNGPLHTSIYMANCYADKNQHNGYEFVGVTYSVLSACAADNNTQSGYWITGSSTFVINGCGVESSGRSAVYMVASSPETANRNIIIDGLLAFNNNKSAAGYANALHVTSTNGARNEAIIRGSRSLSPANPTPDVIVTGRGAYVVDEHNDFPSGVNALSGGYIQHVPKVLLVEKLIEAPTQVCALHSTLGGQLSYSGEITVRVSNQVWSSQRTGNIAIYKLLVSKDSSGISIIETAKTGRTAGDGASAPSMSWAISPGSNLVATPVGSAKGVFFFEILTSDFVKAQSL